MDALANSRVLPHAISPVALRRLLVGLSDATLSALCAAAILLVWRRLSGAMHRPLDEPLLLAIVSLLALAGFTLSHLRRQMARDRGPRPTLDAWNAMWTIVTGAIIACMLLPGSSLVGFALAWLVFFAERSAGYAVARFGGSLPAADRRLVPVDSDGAAAGPTAASQASDVQAADEPAEEDLPDFDPHVVQQIVRRRLPAGGEQVEGLLRAEFAARQRFAALHIAFCPPLMGKPEMRVAPVDGPPATASITLLETFGARVQVRLDCATNEPCHVLVHFTAIAAPTQAAPAVSRAHHSAEPLDSSTRCGLS